MRIRCWGARGSIPVSGPEYLKYGGDTTCVEVRATAGDIIIIDAGSGIRRLGGQLVAEGATEMDLLFTHAHWDHLLGFPFFKPLYRPGVAVRVFGSPFAQKTIQQMLSETMSRPNFPVPLEEVHADVSFHESGDCPGPLNLGGVTVVATVLSHPDRGLGYKFIEGGRAFVFLTDNELGLQHPGGGTFDDYVGFCAGADLLIHDAEFAPEEYEHTRGWGHSTWADALALALRAGVKSLGLYHHNQDRTDEEVDAFVASCRGRIARENAELECFAVSHETQRRL